MRVLVVSQYYWPENFRINELVTSLIKRGVEVDVLTGKPNYPKGEKFSGYGSWGCQQEVHQGILINRLPMLARGKSALRLAANYLSFVISGLIFAPWMLRGKKYDVIFVYAPSPILQAIPAIFLGWQKCCPVALWVQDLWPESLKATGFIRNDGILVAVGKLVQWIYRHTDSILVQSEAFIDQVAALADRRKIVFYPNSADDIFALQESGGNCPIEGLGEGFSVVFAGNIGVAQSIDTILDAAAILLVQSPEIRLFLVGDGSCAKIIKDAIENRNLKNIVMTGYFPPESMPAIFAKADALLATLADKPIFSHTIPSKVQTYLAAGRPIIACLNGEGQRIVCEAEAGICCPAEDGVALAAAITELAAMSENDRWRFGENGRRYFQTHYSSSILTQTLISYFEDMIRGTSLTNDNKASE